MKKLIISSLLLMFLPFVLHCRQVTNVLFEQKGDLVYIYYHIDEESDVRLYISFDGRTYSNITHECTGDIRLNIKAGKRKIVWEVLKWRDSAYGNNIVFRVDADESYNQRQKKWADEKKAIEKRDRIAKTLRNMSIDRGCLYEAYGFYALDWLKVGLGIGTHFTFDFSSLNFRIGLIEIHPASFTLSVSYDSNPYIGTYYGEGKKGCTGPVDEIGLEYQPSVRAYLPLRYTTDWYWYFDLGVTTSILHGGGIRSSFINSENWHKTWVKAETGVQWMSSHYVRGDFFIRYNGGIMLGASINIFSGWRFY